VFDDAGVNAQQVADRAVLDYGRADRDKTYQAPIPDRTMISQEVYERKDGQSDYDPHDPFCSRTYVLQHGSPSCFQLFPSIFILANSPVAGNFSGQDRPFVEFHHARFWIPRL
jgi:hypothetical protein